MSDHKKMLWASVRACIFQLPQVVNSFTTMVNMQSVSSLNNQRTISNGCWTTTAAETAKKPMNNERKKSFSKSLVFCYRFAHFYGLTLCLPCLYSCLLHTFRFLFWCIRRMLLLLLSVFSSFVVFFLFPRSLV